MAAHTGETCMGVVGAIVVCGRGNLHSCVAKVEDWRVCGSGRCCSDVWAWEPAPLCRVGGSLATGHGQQQQQQHPLQVKGDSGAPPPTYLTPSTPFCISSTLPTSHSRVSHTRVHLILHTHTHTYPPLPTHIQAPHSVPAVYAGGAPLWQGLIH